MKDIQKRFINLNSKDIEHFIDEVCRISEYHLAGDKYDNIDFRKILEAVDEQFYSDSMCDLETRLCGAKSTIEELEEEIYSSECARSTLKDVKEELEDRVSELENEVRQLQIELDDK